MATTAADRPLFVLDRDGVAQPVSRALFRKHLASGNLSEKILVSATGDAFEPLENATWLLEDYDAQTTPAQQAIPHSQGQSPLTRALPLSADPATGPDARSRRSFGTKIRGGSFKMSSLIPNNGRPFRSEGTPPSRQSSRGGPVSPLTGEALPHIASRSPASPALSAMGSPMSNTMSLFADKPDDFGESLSALVSELRHSLVRAELLQADLDSSGPSLRLVNEDLRKENARLRALVEAMTPTVQEHAPHILQSTPGEDVSPLPANIQADDSFVGVNVPDQQQQQQPFSGLKVQFDADSPMLREKMEQVESEIDGIRQILKSCVKSGHAFVQAAASFHDNAQYFVEDLRQARSTMPILGKLADAIAGEVEGQMKLMENLESKFLRPLSIFANNDLKGANHIRAELERKREVFENLEARYMSSRRGKDRQTSTPQALVAHVDGAPKLMRSASSGQSFAITTFSGEETGGEKKLEMLNAEKQYEYCRYRLIATLNKLWINHGVMIHKCVMSLASSLANYHNEAHSRVHDILGVDKQKGAIQEEDAQRLAELCDQIIRRKQQEPENSQVLVTRRLDAEPDLIYEGWLWKRSSNVMRDWKKRFFQIVGGNLQYFRNMLEREVVTEVHLCTVRDTPRTSGRDAPPPKTAFEVIYPKRSLVLMAATEEEKDAWIAAIREAIKRSLGQVAQQMKSLESGKTQADIALELFTDDPLNQRCFECHSPLTSAEWVVINLGVFVCIQCSGVHRSLGTHVSKVRSLLLDHLPDTQLDILRRIGNARAGKIWEAKSDAAERRLLGNKQFIHEKYVDKAFLGDEDDVSPEDFASMILDDHLKRVAWFLAHGQQPYYISQHTTALHVAASEPNTSPAMVEFLLLNGCPVDAVDEQGRTAMDIAVEKGSAAAQSVLKLWSHSKSSTAAEDV